MFKPSAQDFLTSFGTLQRYTTLFDSFTDFSFHFYATLNFFSIMVRLTDVQRGRAIALLMQGQRQQQVANHFRVNVSTIERLVRRLRETGHLADRLRSGRVLFTDESRFTLYRTDGRRRVYRRRGERFADACVVERDRFWGGSVMVWGGIAQGIKSQLIIVAGNITAVRYRDEILRPVAVPLVQQRNLILQQDNARPHVARVCKDFLANNNIAPLAWPPYSPDLTPIEHMWDELDRRVRKRRNPPAILAQLRNALIDEWNNIPMRTVNALDNSIQRRIRAARQQEGGIPDIDFQFDFDFKIWGVATNELQ